MRLFLDDLRPCPAGYECCRGIEEAKDLLSYTGFDYISLDYDLGFDQETGLDLLVWMYEEKIFVPHVNIHSTHPLGRKMMWDYVLEHFPGTTVSTLQPPAV